jgi:hypothetical protein
MPSESPQEVELVPHDHEIINTYGQICSRVSEYPQPHGIGRCITVRDLEWSRDFRLTAEVSQTLGWAIALCGRTSLYNAAP